MLNVNVMRQAVMTMPGAIEFRQVPKPVPGGDELLVRVRRIGVCGSDIHVYHGTHPYTTYPVVQGHEVSGTVDSMGDGVRGFAAGDRVIIMPQVTCGACYPCRHGMYHICDHLRVMGFQTGGAAQEYFPVSAAMALKIPEPLGLDPAAMIEPLAVAVHALSRFGDVRGKSVAVLGAGTIGNMVAQAARASGAKCILITDVSAYRLEKARRVGCSLVVDPRRQDLGEAWNAFGPDGADVILECAGSQEAMADAIRLARRGSTVVVVGVFGTPPAVDLGLVQDRELVLAGSLMYRKNDFEAAIAMAASGAIDFDDLITHRFAFEDYPAAYRTIDEAAGNIMKVIIALD
ncbi:MAG: alcohol dehydrogenase catalytic domain-containing protein [Candidatus Solibacter sp.]|nr:alcohol dehydrogenase catalytic domain-containing protein [Candidatus Solibacter sp.]